jgi:hypothetical protein
MFIVYDRDPISKVCNWAASKYVIGQHQNVYLASSIYIFFFFYFFFFIFFFGGKDVLGQGQT